MIKLLADNCHSGQNSSHTVVELFCPVMNFIGIRKYPSWSRTVNKRRLVMRKKPVILLLSYHP